jgi:hypothetical protein
MSTGPLESAAPTTPTIVGGVYNVAPPTPASGQGLAFQQDATGNLLVNVVTGGGSNASVGATGATAPTSATEIGIVDGTGKLQGVSSSNPVPISVGRVAAVTASWTSATPQDTVLSLAVSLFQTVVLSLNITGTISAGVATYEVSDDGVIWYPTLGYRSGIAVGDPNSSLFNPGNASVLWQFNVAGFTNFRVRLSSVIVGTGTATYRLQAASGNQTSPGTNISAVAGNAVLTQLVGALPVTIKGGSGFGLETSSGVLDENIKNIGNSAVVTAAAGIQKVGVVGATGTALDGTTAGIVDENVKNVGGSAVVTAAAGVQKVGVVGGTNVSLETTAGVLDHNLKNVNNAAVVTAAAGVQLVGIEGRAGTSFETTAGVLDENIKNVGNSAVVTAAAGVQKVGIVGNTGAVLDGVITAATAPVNGQTILSVNNTTAPSLTTGQSVALQSDYEGSVFVKPYRRAQTISAARTITNSSAAITLLAAQAAGIFADISNLVITVVPVTGVVAESTFTATLSDGTTSYLFDMDAGDLGSTTIPGTPPTNVNINFNPPLPATTAAAAWTIALSLATVTVHITVVAVLQKAS